MTSPSNKAIGWSSRWTFIMAATGSAVGLGNIWKFPYVAGENGGGAFVLLYIFCIAIIGLPVLISEIIIGRNAKSNPTDAMLKAARQSDVSRGWAGIGIMGAVTGILILSFYSVVGGWILDYLAISAQGFFSNNDSISIIAHFEQGLLSNPNTQFLWFSVFILMSVGVVAAGVVNGVGVAVRIMMPTLAVLLVVLLIYCVQEGAFNQAFAFVFNADFSKLTSNSVLEALGHAMFSVSVGMGAIMAYGAYMPDNASIGKTAVTVALFDTIVSLACALIVFSLVFDNGIEPSAGPQLMFISIPIAFSQMTGGTIFAVIFFALVLIAAWSSAISLLESSVAWIDAHTRFGRVAATFAIGAISWTGGIACIYVGGIFDGLDFLTSNILLPIGALLIAIFTGWKLKRKIAKTQLADLSFGQFNTWYGILRVFTPLCIFAVFIYGLWDIFF